MKNYLKSALIGLTAFLSVSTALADVFKSVEVVTASHGTREVFVTTHEGRRARVGAIETWKKGTLLYHWGPGTPEQAARWDAEGRISPEVLERLKAEKSGHIGSGFYASTNPVDSHLYGNVLVVIELPRDIEIIRSDEYAPGGSTAGWNEVIDKAGVTGATHSYQENWINMRDADALTKEFVMTPEKIEKLKPHGAFTSDELKNFILKHPEYAETKWYKREFALSERMEKTLTEKSGKLLSTLRRVLKKGSPFSAGFVAQGFSGTDPLPADILRLFMEKNDNYEAFHMILEVNKPLAIEVGLTSRTDKGLTFAFYILDTVSLEEQSAYLQKATEYWGEKTPSKILNKIEAMKSRGEWNPPAPVCSRAFAP